jgi:hypothetical protein
MTRRSITAAGALAELQRNGVLVDVTVTEPLPLRALCADDELNQPIRLTRCSVSDLEGPCIQFAAPVVFEECEFGSAELFAAYFLAGLTVAGCTFMGRVDFQCGGHNRGGAAVCLEDSRFLGFVNFYDCWYEGPFQTRRCAFEGGTNLLGNRAQPFEVQFDVQPELTENSGTMDHDGETAA